jgi:ABC-type sulfate transport system substrate-binding protein
MAVSLITNFSCNKHIFKKKKKLIFFKFSHWGKMTGDLSVKLGNGKKLEAPATNEVVESVGVTVAKVNEKFEIEEVRKKCDTVQKEWSKRFPLRASMPEPKSC